MVLIVGFGASLRTQVYSCIFQQSAQKWKTGLILCFLNRAKMICSSKELFNQEANYLDNIFFKNGYPNWFFDQSFKKFKDTDKLAQKI